MKPIIYAILGAIFYGLSTVIIEQKLSKIHSMVIIICYFPIVILFSIILWKIFQYTSPSPSLNIPTDKTTWTSFLTLGIIVFCASFFFLGAFTSGGNAIVVSSLLILAQIAATIFRNFWIKEIPNPYQITGYLLAAIAIILISLGNKNLQH